MQCSSHVSGHPKIFWWVLCTILSHPGIGTVYQKNMIRRNECCISLISNYKTHAISKHWWIGEFVPLYAWALVKVNKLYYMPVGWVHTRSASMYPIVLSIVYMCVKRLNSFVLSGKNAGRALKCSIHDFLQMQQIGVNEFNWKQCIFFLSMHFSRSENTLKCIATKRMRRSP